MRRIVIDTMLNESGSLDAEFKEELKNNPERNKFIEIAKSHGYKVYGAFNYAGKKTPEDKFFDVNFAQLKDDYHPSVYYESKWSNKKPFYKIQTTSYGAMDDKEYEKFLKDCTDALEMVKELRKIDVSKFPTLVQD